MIGTYIQCYLCQYLTARASIFIYIDSISILDFASLAPDDIETTTASNPEVNPPTSEVSSGNSFLNQVGVTRRGGDDVIITRASLGILEQEKCDGNVNIVEVSDTVEDPAKKEGIHDAAEILGGIPSGSKELL